MSGGRVTVVAAIGMTRRSLGVETLPDRSP
jgi:hypothetical protein